MRFLELVVGDAGASFHWSTRPITSLTRFNKPEHNVVVADTIVEMKREFVYERFARDIKACGNVKDLQDIACKFLRLYLAQQEAVDSLIKQGWLPKGSGNDPN